MDHADSFSHTHADHSFSSSASTVSHPGCTDFDFDLDAALTRIAAWLPTQGLLKDFVHHNPLHHLEHLPFHDALALAAQVYGARSYLPLREYQALYQQGRITPEALQWALDHAQRDAAAQARLRAQLFAHDDTLHLPPLSLVEQNLRTQWLNHLAIDLDARVQPVMFRLLGNYLDQGISLWVMPKPGERFWDCVVRLVQNSLLPLFPFRPDMRAWFDQSPAALIRYCLRQLVGDATQWYEAYLLAMQLRHPGWSGMVRVLEQNPAVLREARAISLQEVIAVELACELAFVMEQKGPDFLRAGQYAALYGLRPLCPENLRPQVPLPLKIWHEALEWSRYFELLVALRDTPPPSAVTRPTVQVLCCIDDREGSLRRHLEELDPDLVTFGAPGFFGIDFWYQSADDPHPVAQCPPSVQPRHLLRERPTTAVAARQNGFWEGLAHLAGASAQYASHPTPLRATSHSLWRGWLHTQLMGLGYAVRMVWEVFRPGGGVPTLPLRHHESPASLPLLREDDTPDEHGWWHGFTIDEMADKLARLLRTIGLTESFAPLVVVIGHGSSSVNNPHFAAYDCGACAGKSGAPNARALADIANHPDVRAQLAARHGILIPHECRFVAALHDTSRDTLTAFDAPALATPWHALWKDFQRTAHRALHRNARERCRWFALGPGARDEHAAHRHVNARAASIFEPRPELNHSNNLYCIVGRRALTRQLFLDRRAFLHSYAPLSDATGDTLAGILRAVIPVCGGINLEYLFSRLDNSVYGAGSKLPYNIIGLLGVANGVEGDLRTGLPAQMIELHEPARLLLVIEQTPETIERALAQLGALRHSVDHSWLHLVACSPTHPRQLVWYAQGQWRDVSLPAALRTPTAKDSTVLLDAAADCPIPVHRLGVA